MFCQKSDAGVVNGCESHSYISIWPLPAKSHFDFGFGVFEVTYKSLDDMRISCDNNKEYGCACFQWLLLIVTFEKKHLSA